MEVTKKDLICGIVDLFDEIERLKKELELKPKETQTPCNSGTQYSRIYEYGFNQLFENHVCNPDKNYYSIPEVSVTFDGTTYKSTQYKDWVERFVKAIPENFSKQEFIDIIEERCKKVYAEKLEESKQKAKHSYDADMKKKEEEEE